jgi:Putative zinc-finger
MTTPAPNDLPRELLAAYVDGELDPDARARVERWLADHTDAREELNAQRALSPANHGLWGRVDPPEPSEGKWGVCFRGVEHQLTAPAATRRWRAGVWVVAGLATAGVAAALAWVAFGPATAPQSKPQTPELVRDLPRAPLPREVAQTAPRSDDPLAGLAVLAMATDDDVILDRVPEFPAGWLPVGRHPLQGIMTLASEEELFLAELGPSAAWPTGTPKMTTAPGDAPMIYAAKLR